MFSKGIISPLLAASALKMTAFSPLAHMHRVLISLYLTVLINVKKSVLSAVRNTAVIVLGRIGSGAHDNLIFPVSGREADDVALCTLPVIFTD